MPRAERYADPEYRAALKAARLDPTHAEQQLAGLTSHLEWVAKMARIHKAQDDWAYLNLSSFVLARGRAYTAAPRPKGMRKMTNKLCFRNALYTVWEDRSLTYVEGYALAFNGIPCEHAWAVRPDGTVVDPTWYDPDLAAYYGVEIPLDIVHGRIIRNNVFGILVNDWRNDCAILRTGRFEPLDRLEEEAS